MSDKAPSSKHFEPVEDAKEAEKLIREAGKGWSPAMIWTADQDQVINSHISLVSQHDKMIYVWIPPELDIKGFKARLEASPNHECFFSVSLARANIFFKTRFRQLDEAGLRFDSPNQIFKVQRRKDMRYPVQPPYQLRVSIDDPVAPTETLQRRVFDISASGLSFIIGTEEVTLFGPDQIFEKMEFNIRQRVVRARAEVRHVKPFAKDSVVIGYKVGVRFLTISASDAQWIAAYVFEESRKYFSHVMGG